MKYVIRCNSFELASRVAAGMNLRLADWQWFPHNTIHETIEIYTLESETTSQDLPPRNMREKAERLRSADLI